MGGPSMASMKFGFWLVCVTFLLHCLLIQTVVSEIAQRTYKVKRGVRRTGVMPREAYIPKPMSKNSKQRLCGIECFANEECVAFNFDKTTGKCELFDIELGGSLVIDANWSYFGEISAGITTTTTATKTTTTTTTPSTTTAPDRCMLLIGGYELPNDAAPVEYYHPTDGVECNIDIIGNMSTEEIVPDAYDTSGCHLPSTEQVVIREGRGSDKPSMLYELKDGSAKPLPRPYPTTIYGSTAASVGSSRCISCGGHSGEFLNNCYQYDPSLDESKWTPIAPMPYQRNFPASVSLTTNDIYVMGGDDGVYSNKMSRFNVGDGAWHEEAPMSTKRGVHAAAVLSEKEFIVCGGRGITGGTLSSCEIYDATLKNWRNAASLNQARRGFAMIPLDGDIYALGGFDGNVKINTVEKYDPATGEWKMAKAMQHPRAWFFGVRV